MTSGLQASATSPDSAAASKSSGWIFPTNDPSKALGRPSDFSARWAAFCPDIIMAPKVGPCSVRRELEIRKESRAVYWTCDKN